MIYYFYRMYTFTNENIKGYYNHFKLNDSKVLTVAASGDQVLHAILKGCKKIDSFDINVLVKYFQNLKINAIKVLSLDDYMAFFDVQSNMFLNESLFNKIKLLLDQDTYDFWSGLYSNYMFRKSRSELFFCNNDMIDVQKRCDYLNPKDYLLLRQNLKDSEVNFIESDILSLKDKIDEKYDAMFFSNIYDYLDEKGISDFDDFKLFVRNMGDKLTTDGKIQCYYNWYSCSPKSKAPFIVYDCHVEKFDLESVMIYDKKFNKKNSSHKALQKILK